MCSLHECDLRSSPSRDRTGRGREYATWAVAGPFPPGTYYWRVEAKFDDGSTHQSDVWSFTVTTQGDGKSTFADAAGDARGAGSLVGAEYLFRLNGENGSFGFWSWEQDHWIYGGTPSTSMGYGPGGIVATFDRYSVGGEKTTGFNFWFETLKGDGDTGEGTWEYAPDASDWNVQLAATATAAPTIRTFAVRATPPAPVAGSPFRIRVPSVALSDGRRVTPGSVTCRAFFAGRPLPASGPCTFRIPATATGKRLNVRVTATYVDAVATRTLTFVVRRPA